MASQFFGLNIGRSGLMAFQAAINTTANNVSNVQTEGYSRQTTVLEAGDPLRIYAKYGSMGSGVAATAVIQERSLYYDVKYRQNNSNNGYFQQKLYYLDQIQTILRDDESSQKGYSTIFSEMFAALDTLTTHGEQQEVRNQFIQKAQSLCTYFNLLSKSLTEMQEDCNEEIKSAVQNINSISEKIAVLNKQINDIEVRGGHANELRDKRANLLDELSGIVEVETREYDIHNTYGQDLGGTNFLVYINGQQLVDGKEFRTLECVPTRYINNQTDIEGLYSISWTDTGMDFPASGGVANGTLKGLFDVRDGNNKENMKGTVDDNVGETEIEIAGETRTVSTVTLNHPTVTDVNAISLPNRGQITINNKHYDYESWEATVDENGITSVTFALTKVLDTREADGVKGREITCGKTVDALGIPYYQNQTNEFLRAFARAFNEIEQKGLTMDEQPMGAFFVGKSPGGTIYDGNDWDDKVQGGYPLTFSSWDDTYYGITAQSICVNSESIHNSNYFATASELVNGVAKYDIMTELKKLEKDTKMFRGTTAEAFLETLISDVTVDVNKTETCSTNYGNMVKVIGQQRTSVAGVDEDEEALNLIKFQNAYNLASKVISVMNEIYNKLINETGVT